MYILCYKLYIYVIVYYKLICANFRSADYSLTIYNLSRKLVNVSNELQLRLSMATFILHRNSVTHSLF